MSKTVAGKKPLSQKPKRQGPLAEPDFFTNKLSLPAETTAAIKAAGMEYRWIDYKKYVADGNSHSRGWQVYRSKPTANQDAFTLGANPDGIIRRGSTVLAVRPLEYGEKHRAWLSQKANIYKGFKQSKAEELRQMAKDASADSIVDDVFDGDDGDEQ
jgi:hypothetical protein